MATIRTQFKSVQLTKEETKKIKAGYADTNIGGTGGNGFIIWDDVDPRDDYGLALATSTDIGVSLSKKKVG